MDIGIQTPKVLIDRTPKKVHRFVHDANAALTTIDATFSLLGGASNPRASELYKKAHKRMSLLISELLTGDDLLPDFEVDAYQGVEEKTFHFSHESVVHQTEYFTNIMANRKIFETYESDLPAASVTKAKVVGIFWHQFSEFMPWFLCRAASKVATNEVRHYVIQTAFEELGMRQSDKIHADMFWKSALIAGITENDRATYCDHSSIKVALNFLKSEIEKYTTDAQILGILLGLEIPAKENIECIYKSLCYDENVKFMLDKSEFFRIHREIEIEHVRLTVSNFLRFCIHDQQKNDFNQGFHAGLDFWDFFWKSVSRQISHIQINR